MFGLAEMNSLPAVDSGSPFPFFKRRWFATASFRGPLHTLMLSKFVVPAAGRVLEDYGFRCLIGLCYARNDRGWNCTKRVPFAGRTVLVL